MRTLQVHPDKGGSKEAFHLVYKALEILSDRRAREKYDALLAAPGEASVQARPRPQQKRKQKQKQKRDCRVPCRPKANTRAGPHRGAASRTFPARVHRLLRMLPRELRQEVIRNYFSQKQRLLLEEWMQQDLPKQQKPAAADAEPAAAAADMPSPAHSGAALSFVHAAHSVGPADSSDGSEDTASDEFLYALKDVDEMDEAGEASGAPSPRRTGCVRGIYRARAANRYRAEFTLLPRVRCKSGERDMSTALDYLVCLARAKELLQLHGDQSDLSLQGRLEEALATAASEQGRTVEDMALRLRYRHSSNFWFGSTKDVYTPYTSLSKIGAIYSKLAQFDHEKFWWRRVPDPEHEWTRFQAAFSEACKIAAEGDLAVRRVPSILSRAQALYDDNAAHRMELKRCWDRKLERIQQQRDRESERNCKKTKQHESLLRCCLQRWQAVLERDAGREARRRKRLNWTLLKSRQRAWRREQQRATGRQRV